MVNSNNTSSTQSTNVDKFQNLDVSSKATTATDPTTANVSSSSSIARSSTVSSSSSSARNSTANGSNSSSNRRNTSKSSSTGNSWRSMSSSASRRNFSRGVHGSRQGSKSYSSANSRSRSQNSYANERSWNSRQNERSWNSYQNEKSRTNISARNTFSTPIHRKHDRTYKDGDGASASYASSRSSKSQKSHETFLPGYITVPNYTTATHNSFVPLDPTWTISKRSNIVTIDQLMSSDPPTRNTIIYLIFLRIVSPSHTNDGKSFIVRNLRNNPKNKQSEEKYTRLFLCMNPLSKRGQTLYIAEGRGVSSYLWNKVSNMRDDGFVSVGSVLAIPCPLPITKLLGNDVPLLETNASCIVMKTRCYETIDIDPSLPDKTTRGFILNNAFVEVDSIDVISTRCHGHFCDKQKSAELMRRDKPCGCYFMRGVQSGLAVIHRIKIKHGNRTYIMNEFSSMKFSLLYLTEYFPNSTKRIDFDQTEHMDALYDSIDKIMNHHNNTGGFTVIGWYKRGAINDQSVEDETAQVISSEVNYHMVSIYPTTSEKNSDLLQQAKFDVMKISGV